ncbi:SMI1/KNR4 family protein [Trinickia sp. LjRoot230]|uniref:SMI1/KNR4 family protein n=1 Tax=Trinickia sp. LjRoot230 TaxID=3342288 RepID=UPI003ED0312B
MNKFERCEKPLTRADIDAAEEEVGMPFPTGFREHYLRYNGGIPALSCFPATEECEPIEVATFFPIKYNSPEHDLKRTVIEGKYHFMRGKGVIPEGLLPFAGDHGGNFFCLDLKGGDVYFFATDAFDPDLSLEENHEKAKRWLTHSFEEFLISLTHDEDAY